MRQLTPRQLLESNMRLKLSGPDYKTQNPVDALEDFRKRVAMYEKKYIPLGENEERNGHSYCQMVDVGRKFVMHNIHSFYAFEAVHYLQHFNLLPRQIWLTRHGQSDDDVAGRIGGDAELTPSGVRYASILSQFIDHQRIEWKQQHQRPDNNEFDYSYTESSNNFQVWTSTMRRSKQTAQFFSTSSYDTKQLSMLDELNAGILDGLTREEVREFYSDWYQKRDQDKHRFRYPGARGEGYMDVTNRVKSVILEVERATDHILLISGLAVTRVLLAYFRDLQRDEIADLDVPLGTLFMLEPVSNSA
jgi:6-phosphofructo-2-kinase